MKRHGNYDLPTPEELLKDLECPGNNKMYIQKQLKRHRQRHSGNRRHRQKVRNKYWSIRRKQKEKREE